MRLVTTISSLLYLQATVLGTRNECMAACTNYNYASFDASPTQLSILLGTDIDLLNRLSHCAVCTFNGMTACGR
jgi:hypothetical protein